MCFTLEITGGFMILNLATGLLLTSRGHALARTQIFYTFFLMELLQFLQYFVLGDCSNWLNRVTTVLSYVHICFQPLSVNVFLFRNEPNKDVVKTVHRLCILVGVLAVLRLPYLGLAYLPASIREWLPGLPDLSLAGTSTVCSWESICGPQTCTTKGNLHLAWTVPLLPPSYFTPSGFVHFLTFFGPALIVPGVWTPERKAFLVFAMLSGPFLTQALSYRVAGGDAAWRLEWAGIWCLYAFVQCLLGVGFEMCHGIDKDVMLPGRRGYERYRKSVREGKLFGGYLVGSETYKVNGVNGVNGMNGVNGVNGVHGVKDD